MASHVVSMHMANERLILPLNPNTNYNPKPNIHIIASTSLTGLTVTQLLLKNATIIAFQHRASSTGIQNTAPALKIGIF